MLAQCAWLGYLATLEERQGCPDCDSASIAFLVIGVPFGVAGLICVLGAVPFRSTFFQS